MNVFTIVVPRASYQEHTLAVVTVATDLLPGKVYGAIKRACSAWAKETECGLEAWKRSSRDFNVGDLSDELDPEYWEFYDREYPVYDIETYLQKEGILALKIECFVNDDCHSWNYDDYLIEDPVQD